MALNTSILRRPEVGGCFSPAVNGKYPGSRSIEASISDVYVDGLRSGRD